ncbi:hypothetical protein D3C75_803910 [compost metagenome]
MFQLGLEQPHHQAHHRTRGVELATFLAGRVGKLANQVLIGSAKQVGKLEVSIAQSYQLKVIDQLAQLNVGDLALAHFAGEVDVFQHPFQ